MPHQEISQPSQPSRNTWGFELGRFVNIPNLGLAIVVAFATSWLSGRDAAQETAFQLREIQRIQEAQAAQVKDVVAIGGQNAAKLEALQITVAYLQRQLDQVAKDRAEDRRGR
jgi:hypothetical protein